MYSSIVLPQHVGQAKSNMGLIRYFQDEKRQVLNSFGWIVIVSTAGFPSAPWRLRGAINTIDSASAT